MDLRNDLRQIQAQRLSPLMLRSLNILQLSAEELQRLVSAEIQRNPLLDIAANDISMPLNGAADGDGNGPNFLENIAAEHSPQEYLLAQVPDVDETTKVALMTLIDHLDGRGFLSDEWAQGLKLFSTDVGEISDSSCDYGEEDVFRKAYAILRSLSPRGIGARNLQDCLLLQISKNTPLHGLVANHFGDLEHRRFSQLRRILRRTASELRTLLLPLRHLHFAPLEVITSHANPVILPEIVFRRADGEWGFEVRGMLPVKMSGLYKELLMHPLKGEDKKFFMENKRHARFWIQSLQRRRETLQKIACYILKFQVDFLENGHHFLCPHSQKQIAELLEMHPSTLSRAIQNKYAQTPHGMVPLHFFFSHGNHGSLTASNGLKENIRDIIHSESKGAPFSDEKIAQMLREKGIWIMRRTVAKYRATLRIPPANARKYI